MPLSRGLDDALTPGTKDIAAPKLDLVPQLVEGLLVFFERLIVHYGRLVESGSEVANLLIEIVNLLDKPVQQLVAFAWISRP